MSSRSVFALGTSLLTLMMAACGGASAPLSPTAPTSSTNPTPTSVTRVLQGQTASAADSSTLAGVSVRLGTLEPTTSDASGYFRVESTPTGASTIDLTGPSIVDRHTDVRLPADGVVRFGLIPASFDLAAFNEMFRGSHDRLQRWTAAPSLVVLTTVMRFESGDATTADATSEQIPPGEVDAMVRDLTDALSTLTGGTFTAFAQATREAAAAGSRTTLTRNGQIVVGRYRDIRAATGSVGFGRWAEREDGVVTAGTMFLDAGYDSGSDKRRLRTHELGHALGYKHLSTRPSIMNPILGSDVTEFDRQGALIAFQRPPGNRAPDTDPASSSLRSLTDSTPGRWVTAIP
jgi:hypothetical protein